MVFSIQTRLISAAGYADCAEVLIKKGSADVNVKDKDGTTPLHLACTINNLDLVRLLIAHGAKGRFSIL
jgi:ankyrin repeat protein